MANTTVVRLLKDLGQDFGCVGDVYKNAPAQMEALKARAAKLKISLKDAYEVVEADVEKVAEDVKEKVTGKK